MQIVEAYRILSDESIRKKFDSDINNARIRFWGYTPSNDQKWIFSNLNELYNRIKERQDERAKSGRSNVRYLGKTTNALIRKGPMVLMNSIASAVKTFTINSRPTEEEASNK